MFGLAPTLVLAGTHLLGIIGRGSTVFIDGSWVTAIYEKQLNLTGLTRFAGNMKRRRVVFLRMEITRISALRQETQGGFEVVGTHCAM